MMTDTPTTQTESDPLTAQFHALWGPTADREWTIQRGPRGTILAANHRAKMATEPARRMETLLTRLKRGSYSYWLYVKWAKPKQAA
ncbi:MAG: hypothetical protein DCC55_34955 [Chloroflexi bacterium]|nr:MAG: hypothetical protein DCC55_34955 [Chloroflexota bacterium]